MTHSIPIHRSVLAAALLAGMSPSAPAGEEDEFARQRMLLMQEVDALVAETRAETGTEALSPRVSEAMRRVPRHRYVPEDEVRHAYKNRPLPIGYGQTISQPYIVAIMTDLMQVREGDRVFELGTGSGYQAAVLGELAAHVYTIEIVEPLAERAARTLTAQGYENVQVKAGDGYYGWEEHAPFDAIIVTAAASHVPPPLIQQLAPGGRMVIPLGTSFMTQHLMLVEKDEDGRVRTREVLPVMFVPLTGGH
ncbi:MAG: protein-L-isoaspartate(D-aspartate) O-methyltransferase [Gammaproteobacteria bacterium]